MRFNRRTKTILSINGLFVHVDSVNSETHSALAARSFFCVCVAPSLLAREFTGTRTERSSATDFGERSDFLRAAPIVACLRNQLSDQWAFNPLFGMCLSVLAYGVWFMFLWFPIFSRRFAANGKGKNSDDFIRTRATLFNLICTLNLFASPIHKCWAKSARQWSRRAQIRVQPQTLPALHSPAWIAPCLHNILSAAWETLKRWNQFHSIADSHRARSERFR